MKLTYLGHSSFLIESASGVRLVTDPYHPYIGISMPKVTADIVTVSHAHKDHSYTYAVSGFPKVLDSVGEFEVDGIKIRSIKSWHDDKRGALRGENLIFLIEMDGLTVCHLGDIGEKPSRFNAQALGKVDILLIPIGGVYTITSAEAKLYVNAISPSVVLPMHYKVERLSLDISDESEFVSRMGGARRIEGELTFDSCIGDENRGVYLLAAQH